ncbi:hypothetical protein [Clostridium sp. Marseille-P299]|uniref:hypothetical protein n=1 Tax=Clostridium sp. Marseille-P299 TaxID=1805477 RepID=UPI00082A7624|nr:hypothetical protein [Clostridium sp. Marseille-P299]
MKNVKRVVALAGVVLLLSLYVVSLISAIFAKPYANGLFMASLFCTIVIPILLYGFLIVYRQVHKEDDGISIKELRKMNKEMKLDK